MQSATKRSSHGSSPVGALLGGAPLIGLLKKNVMPHNWTGVQQPWSYWKCSEQIFTLGCFTARN